jgi:rod shape-determining protein MreC
VSSELTTNASKERAILVLIPLLVLHLALLSIQIQSSSGTLLIKTWTLTVQAPILSVSSSVTGGFKHIWQNYVWTVGARAENERLQKTVHQLMLINNSFAQSQKENERLRRLLAMNDLVEFQSIGARVVARTPAFLSNMVYIDRGSADGVHADAAVLSGDGVIGRVTLVTKHQSQVQLITNPDASVGALIDRTRTVGVLRGSGAPLLEMAYVGNNEQVEVGDVVVSSGLDRIYPKGLPIGKVVDSSKGKGVFRSITVEPRIDLIRLEEVSVLLNDRKPLEGTTRP